MKKINFGKINRFIIFGGNIVSLELCKLLNKKKISCILFTTHSQANEIIFDSNQSFKKHLVKNKVKFKVVSNINNKLLKNYINNNTLGISNSCRWIFKEDQIKLFGKRLVNIHFTNLPQNRGSGGLSWDIMMNKFNI